MLDRLPGRPSLWRGDPDHGPFRRERPRARVQGKVQPRFRGNDLGQAEQEPASTDIACLSAEQWPCLTPGPTRDDGLEWQADPGAPRLSSLGQEQAPKRAALVAGELGEGKAVSNAAICRRALPGPDDLRVYLEGASIRLDADLEFRLRRERFGQFDAGSRAAQVTGPARPGTARRGDLLFIENGEHNRVASESSLYPGSGGHWFSPRTASMCHTTSFLSSLGRLPTSDRHK